MTPEHYDPADGTTFRDYPVRVIVTYSCGCEIEAWSPNFATHNWPRQCPKWWHRKTHVLKTADMELVDNPTQRMYDEMNRDIEPREEAWKPER